MSISPTGPIPPEEFKALIDAPHGQALKAIRKYDPFYGKGDGDLIKWRVRLTKEVQAEGFVTVEASSAEEAEALAYGVPDHKIDWDYDDDGTSLVEEVKPRMSTDTHTIADDQVRSAFQRWKNLEEEKARIGEDLKELFSEQKAFGHDTKAMRAAFRLKVKMDEADPADAEHEALVDTYLAALEAPRASRAYARENIEQFPALEVAPDLRPSLTTREAEESVVPHSPETAERAEPADAAVTVGDDLREPVAAEQGQIIREGDAPRETDRLGGDASCPDTESSQSETTAQCAAPEKDAAADEREGGDHEVASSATRAGLSDPTSNTGEGAASALPTKSKLRPHCQRPGNTCGGYGDKHCHDCLRAMREYEAA